MNGGIVRTVLGDVAPSTLGVTLSHEHLVAAPPRGAGRDGVDWVLDDDQRATEELLHFHRRGGGAVVEMTPRGYGRDPERLAELSKATGIVVVACTGFHKGDLFPDDLRSATEGQLADLLVRDICEGDVRAGIVKAGSGMTMTDLERRSFAAVAEASRRTGAPVGTHTEGGALAIEQATVLLEAGLAPERIAIGHLHGGCDRGMLSALAESGVWLGIDNWSREKYSTDEDRAETVQWLLDGGWTRILVSGDLGRRRRLRSYGGSPGYVGLLDTLGAAFPADVRTLLLERNPAEFLTFAA